MPNIRVLPEQLANRIAAGEVVERPASVVKELVENSIDAQALRIAVEVEGGGTRLIRVVDDGSGMDEDDVLLSFERHGTSKINADEDLDGIATLGFRGEAIPSIASVAKMSIISRPHNAQLGTQVEFEYGKLQKIVETGCSKGSVVEVRNLFGRTPARKKFLRTKRTELGHIDEILKNYSLACPNIAFSLKIDGRESFSFNSIHDLEERLRFILNYHGELICIDSEQGGKSRRELHGYLVPPEQPLPGTARMRLFINGRAIKDRLMHHAVIEGLRGFLLKGHTPAGYLHLRIPADEIDVNVHPAKHEVRFRNGRDVHQYIKQNIEAAMQKYQHTIRSHFISAGTEKNQHDVISSPLQTTAAEIEDYQQPPEQSMELREPSGGITSTPTFEKAVQPARLDSIAISPVPANRMRDSEREDSPPPFQLPEKSDPAQIQLSHRMNIIGQFKNLYILCQADENLIIVDQHAAHERLLYEKFRRQYMDGKVASQNLLFPETVELSPFQIELVEKNLPELQKLGFSISEFGGNSYLISSVPAMAGKGSALNIFLDVLDSFGSDKTARSPGGKLDNILANLACKAAIKSGESLSTEEIDELLNQMTRADLFSHCPHGRPVVRKFSPDDIKKWFSRT